MRIGVPKEIKADERRVAIVPSGVAAFRAHNHRVMVEKGAGLGSGISDEAYAAAGAEIVKPAQDVFWGGYSGYFRDPDGHVWEIVWNPQLLPADD